MKQELIDQLVGLGLNEDQNAKLAAQGVSEPSDMLLLNADEIVAHTGCGLIIAKKVVAAFAPVVEATATAATMAFATDILPAAPTDESWISALRAGGVLKVDQSTVISAVRAALASHVGLYEVPDILVKKMEQFADSNDESVPPEFFKIRKQLIRRTYSDIFEVIEGLDGTFVTDGRKKSFLSKVDKDLWPAISSFFDQLKSWMEAWQQGATNSAVMMGALAAMINGGGKMLPGMMTPPDSGTLRDGADALNDSINKVFAGVGVQISAALAYEATKIKDMMEDSKLPSLIGAANREQMLRMLGVDVPATYPRLEINLTRFVLSVIKIKDIGGGDEELQYFGSLYMLGSQIPWDKLGASGGSSLGRGRQL